ncbi:MAG: Membrane dipeptidase (Peptidase family M19) [bacterium ADurb.Bin400]|nr:MAG: Membrane dipeptidase (Peptidase family M19) [bacterium ADurb.Bin400]
MYQIIDLHQDLMNHMRRPEMYPNGIQTNFEYLERNNIKLLIASVFPVRNDEDYYHVDNLIEIEEDFIRYLDQCCNRPGWLIVRSETDLLRLAEEPNMHGLILHLEGLNPIVDNIWPYFERWHGYGWRSVGPVWNLPNALGGGVYDTKKGLTQFGKEVIEWAQDRNMIIDFAHMNEATFRDALAVVKGPILVSHSLAYVVNSTPRNLTDSLLREIAKREGVLGIYLVGDFVKQKNVVEIPDVIDHIDHLVNVMGIDHIALGTDFGGLAEGFVQGLDSVDGLALLWDGMEKRGYGITDIRKVAYDNAWRVLVNILGN